jgi:hypothetical protein
MTELILKYCQLGYRMSLEDMEPEQMKKLTMVDTQSGLSSFFLLETSEDAMKDPRYINFIEESLKTCHKQVQSLKVIRY